ncbi:hypothetical protein N7512_008372 [Penicillium capsulatum]|nr:hypothetical protein N7512_008372 [Penicillium capsulatum]
MPSFLYNCQSRWAGGLPADAPKTDEEALARIDQLYKDGVPFFTKESIRSALEQMQRPATGDGKVFIKGVDGTVVEFDNQLDATRKRAILAEDEELTLYDCRSHLKHRIWNHPFDAELSPFCSMSLYHDTETKSLNPNKLAPKSREAVAELFEKSKRTWGESDSCKRLLAILDSSAAVHTISKIVAVSLGSLVIPRHPKEQESSPFQHALLLTLREWVIQRSAGSPCYTQDPIYTEIDHGILADHGVEILEDPHAWLEMNDQSIVVSISSNVPSREMVTDLARPAVIIWNRVTDDDYDQKGGPGL